MGLSVSIAVEPVRREKLELILPKLLDISKTQAAKMLHWLDPGYRIRDKVDMMYDSVPGCCHV